MVVDIPMNCCVRLLHLVPVFCDMLVTVGPSLCVSGVYKVGSVFIVYIYYRMCLV
jgi:hypothetical protein